MRNSILLLCVLSVVLFAKHLSVNMLKNWDLEKKNEHYILFRDHNPNGTDENLDKLINKIDKESALTGSYGMHQDVTYEAVDKSFPRDAFLSVDIYQSFYNNPI